MQLALAGVGLHDVASDDRPRRHLGRVPDLAADRRRDGDVVGLLIAVSALRVRGVSLVVVTLAAAVALEQFGFLNARWGGGPTGSPVTSPGSGPRPGPDASFRGMDDNLPSPVFGFLVLAATILLALLVANVRRSSLGQRMLAVRSNERAAAASGINVRNTKLAGFGIAAFVAGMAGGLYAYNFGSVSYTRFGPLAALGLIAFTYFEASRWSRGDHRRRRCDGGPRAPSTSGSACPALGAAWSAASR